MNTGMVRTALAAIKAKTNVVPDVCVVLGSGLGTLAQKITVEQAIPYHAIEGFPVPTVGGHEGRLVLGTVGTTRVALLQGRAHLYEGNEPDDVVRPVRTMAMWGVKTLVLTNAAGGINEAFEPGDFMLIRDQINLQGTNPLLGVNDDTLGSRFPDMGDLYAPQLCSYIVRCAREEDIEIHNGVYAGLLGPAYETHAEVRMLRVLGADAVGMSTVAEAIAARHMGMRVCGMSMITNKAAGMGTEPLSHEDVRATADKAGEKFVRLMLRVLCGMGQAECG